MINPAPKPSFKRRRPTRRNRGNFNKKTRNRILERDKESCQICNRKGTQIHHVMPRSRSGRGVYTNGLTVCNSCHHAIHNNNDLLQAWIEIYVEKYGENFYKDEWDEG